MNEPTQSETNPIAHPMTTPIAVTVPLFEADWILYESDDLIAVNKPPWMPTIEAVALRKESLVTRLAQFLAERDRLNAPAYLGVHQRLDGATSGVVLFTKTERYNKALSEHFAASKQAGEIQGPPGIQKFYTALTTKAPPLGRMVHQVKHQKGRTLVTEVQPSTPPNEVAELEVLTAVPKGAYFEVTVRLITGKTHQIRAQLSHIGCPIAGDLVYGGTPFFRMMLHAQRLTLTLPGEREPLTVTAPLPREFSPPDDPLDPQWTAHLLSLALHKRFTVLNGFPYPTNAFRWIERDTDGFADLRLDVFGDVGLLSSYGASREQCDAVAEAALSFGLRSIFFRDRPKLAQRVQTNELKERAASLPTWGEAQGPVVYVREGQRVYEVRFDQGLSVGLFLDQRDTRAFVEAHSERKRVLNLFAYTGAFSVAADWGGAREVWTVDASKTALTWANRNLALNAAAKNETATPTVHRFRADDVFDVLRRLANKNELFDLIIVDPPTSASTDSNAFRSGEDWVRLALAVGKVAAPNSNILMTSNDDRMRTKFFREYVERGLLESGHQPKITSLSAPIDFAPDVSHGWKGLLVHCGG